MVFALKVSGELFRISHKLYRDLSEDVIKVKLDLEKNRLRRKTNQLSIESLIFSEIITFGEKL